jgi:hypothetical protein
VSASDRVYTSRGIVVVFVHRSGLFRRQSAAKRALEKISKKFEWGYVWINFDSIAVTIESVATNLTHTSMTSERIVPLALPK